MIHGRIVRKIHNEPPHLYFIFLHTVTLRYVTLRYVTLRYVTLSLRVTPHFFSSFFSSVTHIPRRDGIRPYPAISFSAETTRKMRLCVQPRKSNSDFFKFLRKKVIEGKLIFVETRAVSKSVIPCYLGSGKFFPSLLSTSAKIYLSCFSLASFVSHSKVVFL